MSSLFSVETIFISILGYPISYLEFVGTLLYLWSVWLIAKRHMLTWPVGIVSVLLFMALFYQIRLYSDALEQLYYLGACAYGWLFWSKSKRKKGAITDVGFGSPRRIFIWIGVTVTLSLCLGGAMTGVHLWFPRLFPKAADFPFIDALTTVMSLVAMWLMVRKQIESWIYWIIVDVIGIWLYFVKEVYFLSLLYVILLGLAIRGLVGWIKAKNEDEGPELDGKGTRHGAVPQMEAPRA